jgi:hypothetical protein
MSFNCFSNSDDLAWTWAVFGLCWRVGSVPPISGCLFADLDGLYPLRDAYQHG